MPKTKFKGPLQEINPQKLIKPDEENIFDIFFLTLGLVYNDIHGLLLFNDFKNQIFEQPKDGEVSSHSGEHAGTSVYINRLIIGTVSEFLTFIRAHKKLLESKQFRDFINRQPKKTIDKWQIITGSVFSSPKGSRGIHFLLAKIRSNISFHYPESPKVLSSGFKKKFYINTKSHETGNTAAYYSIGTSNESTRFFYADAAVEEYIHINLSPDDLDRLVELLGYINDVIFQLMAAYLELAHLKK